MPTTYSCLTRHEGWRQEMNTALKPSSGNDFMDGFLQRQTERDGFAKHRPKQFKSHSTFENHLERRSNFDKSHDNDSFSGNDFVDGFLRQTRRDGFVQHQTSKSLKSYSSSGRNHNERERHINNSNNNESYSGKGFLDGFLRQSKPETDPCGASKQYFYERELLANSTKPRVHSPDVHHTKRCSAASTQAKPMNIRLEHPTESTNSSGGTSRRGLYERGELNTSPDLDFSSRYKRKPSTSSIKTPSLPTRYISTRSSSTTSLTSPANPRLELNEKECFGISTVQSHSSKYTREPLTASIRTPSSSTQYISTTNSISPSTSRFHGCPKLSEADWKETEEKSQQEQKEFLESYSRAGKFEDVPVSSIRKNVRRGSHLFYRGSSGGLYDHHLLCINVDGDYIHTIEYTGPSFGLSAVSQSIASSNILAFGVIKKGKLTYTELEQKKAKIRKWPEELRRFSVDEVISRAESRKHEQDYHVFNNNCEHFVTWCICGLNTSLQVKPFYKLAWENVKGAGVAALGGVPTFLKAIANVSDDFLGAISSSLAPVGFALGGVIETGYAAWNIYQDCKRMKEGRLSQEQFKINSVATGSKALGRIAGGIAGSLSGSPLGPLGMLAGGVIGCGAGHVVGSAVSWCYEHAPTIKKAFQDYVVSPVKKVVSTCYNAVKTAGRAVWEGVKSVFSSLFSWW